MRRSSARLFRIVKVVTLCAAFGAAAEAKEPAEPRQPYRFVVESDGRGSTPIRGLITVDGTDRLIEREQTPYEFRCEAGSVVAGYFESLQAGRTLRLKVYDPAYSKRKSALGMKGFEHFRFSWAQPGVGPRCADPGRGACPDATPSVEEFRRRLESMRDADKAVDSEPRP